jgi:hypothetical protein
MNRQSRDYGTPEWEDAWQTFSDVYKEINNIRPRWMHPYDYTVDELQDMTRRLYEERPDWDDVNPPALDYEPSVRNPARPAPHDPEIDWEMSSPTRSGMGRRVESAVQRARSNWRVLVEHYRRLAEADECDECDEGASGTCECDECTGARMEVDECGMEEER